MQSKVASKKSDNFWDFYECCNEIYALWSVQYFLYCTDHSEYISLTFQNQCNYKIYALALPFDLRCESGASPYILWMDNLLIKAISIAIRVYVSKSHM